FLRGDVSCLEAHVARRPRARHDDGGAHITELTAYSLCGDRLVACLASSALRSGTKDHGVVGAAASGYVDLVDGVVSGEVLTCARTPVADAHEPGPDEVAEDVVEDRTQILIDGVHLEQTHVAFRKELVEHVEWRDAGDVARA